MKIIRHKDFKVTKKNEDFLKNVCSKSGINFHETYYINGNKYCTCLQIFDFDKYTHTGFFNDVIGYQDVLVTMDCHCLSPAESNDKIDKMIEKHQDKQYDAKRFTAFRRALQSKQELQEFSDYVDNLKDSVFQISLRLYVFAEDLEKLQNKVNKLIDKLSFKKMNGFIQTNNLVEDYKALTSFSNPVKKMVASRTIAQFLNHSEINRIDKNMGLIGYTDTGLYAPDIFKFADNYSYNTLDMAGMGAGKSALRKLFEEELLSFGNHILYVFDIHGEYEEYAKKLGIQTISIDEKNNVNLMQIFHVSNEEHTDRISENDISTQIALVSGRFQSATGIDKPEVITHLELLLKDFYRPFIGRSIKQINNEEWFLLEEVLEEANRKYKEHMYESEALQDIYKLRLGLERMIDIYGYLFNRKTNVDFDLTKSIRFDVSFLRSNDDKRVKSSYMSLLLNYISYGMYLNKERNEKAMQARGLNAYDLERPIYTMRILVDETMEYGDIYFFETNLRFLKFARKAYVGLGYVFHDVQDLEKEFGRNTDSGGNKLIREVFSLCTNKYIGKCGEETLNRLHEYIPDITSQDISVISRFEKGIHGERQFFAIDNKKRKIKFTSEITRAQREYFKGGA
ncbi:MAG: DUF87 domain-containing protein [Faecalicoccus sp.]|uniref:helicase HerA domain-containing protein n=1 Tax=Faecalicoccus sp. TaxID=1971758 RepID=UPI002F95EE2D